MGMKKKKHMQPYHSVTTKHLCFIRTEQNILSTKLEYTCERKMQTRILAVDKIRIAFKTRKSLHRLNHLNSGKKRNQLKKTRRKFSRKSEHCQRNTFKFFQWHVNGQKIGGNFVVVVFFFVFKEIKIYCADISLEVNRSKCLLSSVWFGAVFLWL